MKRFLYVCDKIFKYLPRLTAFLKIANKIYENIWKWPF